MQSIFLLALLAFSVAFAGTWAVRKLVLSRALRIQHGRGSLCDVPNHRSSHQTTTPRGGGVAMVLAFLLSTIGLAVTQTLPSHVALGMTGSVLLVALIGFLDDWGFMLSARKRLFVHFAAAGLFVFSVGGIPAFVAFGVPVDLTWAGNVLAAVYLVWMVNLFNFMDGIDGIAAVEAVTVASAGALLWSLTTGSASWMVAVVLAAAAAGFLCWNHPPAKIFMGDAGSCFLGMALGAMAIWAGTESPQLFWSWSILLGCFVVDATTTLLRRLARGKRFDEAHRCHVYQYAARRLHSHKRVTYVYGLVNLLWLFPVAGLVALRYLDGASGLLIAYMPLAWAAFMLKAGALELQE